LVQFEGTQFGTIEPSLNPSIWCNQSFHWRHPNLAQSNLHQTHPFGAIKGFNVGNTILQNQNIHQTHPFGAKSKTFIKRWNREGWLIL
jgi:hypothetical protein